MTLAPEARKALRAARSLLKYELDAIYDCACVLDDGVPRLDTLDDSYKPLVRRYRSVLKQIEKVLGVGAKA